MKSNQIGCKCETNWTNGCSTTSNVNRRPTQIQKKREDIVLKLKLQIRNSNAGFNTNRNTKTEGDANVR